MQAFDMHHRWSKTEVIDYWFFNSDYVCFTNGAWRINKENVMEAGIGGFILNKKR